MRAPEYNWIVVDVETTGRDDARQYLEPQQAPSNWKDPEKIAAEIARKEAAQLGKLSLDWNTCRIVALGYQTDTSSEPSVITCPTEDVERSALQRFWTIARSIPGEGTPTIIGYNVLRFDICVLIQRSRYLGVKVPSVSLRPWDNQDIRDLFQELTFDGDKYCTSVMARTLDNFCKQFGVEVSDPFTGEDVPRLVAEGRWDDVRDHCAADIRKEVALARALGVIQPVLSEVA